MAESIAPAPSPKGRAIKQTNQKEPLKANPKRERAERVVEMATTKPVPSFETSLALNPEEMVVPIEIISETILARESGKFKSCHIAGMAVPKVESGRPKPIYNKNITNKNKVAI